MEPVTTAGSVLFGKILRELYSYVKKTVGIPIEEWKNDQKIDNLYTKMNEIRMVKTLWQADKPLDINEFYCDTHVTIDGERVKINYVNDFGTEKNVLVEGIAGHGKSIFMRHLTANELRKGRYVPIFLELRKIMKNQSLREHIYLAFKRLELNINDDLFDSLADSGRILLFLDGFDEVRDEELSMNVLNEIEQLSSIYPKLWIIATSRPDSGLEMCTLFNRVKMANLEPDDCEAVIRKLSKNSEFTQRLINEIRESTNEVIDLLVTPLMVTLLVKRYKFRPHIPPFMTDFYNSLFEVLIIDHDLIKPAFKRKRECHDLHPQQYLHVFETFCFLSKSNSDISFNSNKFHKLTEDALKINELNKVPTEAFQNDIVKITCLILKDGSRFRFIHKSVQEFYAACFIKNKPEKVINKFYETITAKELHKKWVRELEFLSVIDQYNYNKYYMIPLILSVLGITQSELIKKQPLITMELIQKHIGTNLLVFDINNNESCHIKKNIHHHLEDIFVEELFKIDYKPILNAIESGKLKATLQVKDGQSKFLVKELLNKGYLVKEFKNATDKALQRIFRKGRELSRIIRNEEQDDIFNDFL